MKGVILHGGHGTRLRPLTHTGPKQLLPIANKPMSQYALEEMRDAGVKEIAIIIGDVYPEKVKEYYGDGSKFGVDISYIYQDKPKGISHAIQLTREFVGDEKFLVVLGDNIFAKSLSSYAKKFESSRSDAMILLCKVEDPSRFGVAELDGSGKIVKIVEKPKNPKSDLAVIGVYFLTPKIFNIINNLKPSWRGELEITDALQLLMQNNGTIDYDIVTGWWKDTGTAQDILHANRLVLENISSYLSSNNNYEIKNNILIGKNTTISRDSTVTGPSIIGENCIIGPAVRLGPNVSIGNNVTLKHCEIDDSILMDNCRIEHKIHITESIIASGSEIIHDNERKNQQFLLGERSKIIF